MAASRPAPSYEAWSAICDTVQAHTQVPGKLAAELAPPEPQPQLAALRLMPRGWDPVLAGSVEGDPPPIH